MTSFDGVHYATLLNALNAGLLKTRHKKKGLPYFGQHLLIRQLKKMI